MGNCASSAGTTARQESERVSFRQRRRQFHPRIALAPTPQPQEDGEQRTTDIPPHPSFVYSRSVSPGEGSRLAESTEPHRAQSDFQPMHLTRAADDGVAAAGSAFGVTLDPVPASPQHTPPAGGGPSLWHSLLTEQECEELIRNMVTITGTAADQPKGTENAPVPSARWELSGLPSSSISLESREDRGAARLEASESIIAPDTDTESASNNSPKEYPSASVSPQGIPQCTPHSQSPELSRYYLPASESTATKRDDFIMQWIQAQNPLLRRAHR